MNRRILVGLCAVAALASTVVAPSAHAATDDDPDVGTTAAYPYRDWAQTPGNTAGVVFRPYGDWWEAWDNSGAANTYVQFNYKGVNDAWKNVISGRGWTYAKDQRNVYEKINGEPAYIYFRVCDNAGCSHPSWYRTWGS